RVSPGFSVSGRVIVTSPRPRRRSRAATWLPSVGRELQRPPQLQPSWRVRRVTDCPAVKYITSPIVLRLRRPRAPALLRRQSTARRLALRSPAPPLSPPPRQENQSAASAVQSRGRCPKNRWSAHSLRPHTDSALGAYPCPTTAATGCCRRSAAAAL